MSATLGKDTTYIGRPCKRGHSGRRWKANRCCVDCVRAAEPERVLPLILGSRKASGGATGAKRGEERRRVRTSPQRRPGAMA
jgi:hypothetical protein